MHHRQGALLHHLIERPRLACRAAADSTGENADNDDLAASTQREDIADLHFEPCLLHAHVVAADAAGGGGILRERACLIEARMPEPFVDADTIRHRFAKRAASSASEAAEGLAGTGFVLC